MSFHAALQLMEERSDGQLALQGAEGGLGLLAITEGLIGGADGQELLGLAIIGYVVVAYLNEATRVQATLDGGTRAAGEAPGDRLREAAAGAEPEAVGRLQPWK